MLSCRCLVTAVGLAAVFIFKCCCVVAAEFHTFFVCLFQVLLQLCSVAEFAVFNCTSLLDRVI